jgi:tetrahydromethanopterin S-methyltransferase subunit A
VHAGVDSDAAVHERRRLGVHGAIGRVEDVAREAAARLQGEVEGLARVLGEGRELAEAVSGVDVVKEEGDVAIVEERVLEEIGHDG